ncbi:head-tail adaptor protein [Thioclava sp. GXIMD4215]|uniref:head-tail adaptor protein n=1 Tax=Thioclava sp. GXIMD4215 TaxID=3131928 RepID=UPI003248F898
MAGQRYDRYIQFRRAGRVDDGYRETVAWNEEDPAADNLGLPEPAARADASDGERAAAGWLEAYRVSRFTVRSSAFSRAITPADRLVCDGIVHEILGIKEIGFRDRLEITGQAKVGGNGE